LAQEKHPDPITEIHRYRASVMVSSCYLPCYLLFTPVLLLLEAVHAQERDISEIIFPEDIESVEEIVIPDDGMHFTEGPVWVQEENALYFSDMRFLLREEGRLMRWRKGELTVVREGWQANGNTRDLEGNLVSCNYGLRQVTRLSRPFGSGNVTVLTNGYEGKKLGAPNDIAVKSDGSIWFTDAFFGLYGREEEQDGRYVYRISPTGTLTAVYKGGDLPNGIGFSPDEKRLYIGEDYGEIGTVRVFDVIDIEHEGAQDGLNTTHFREIPLRADGFALDGEENIYIAAVGGVHVYDKDGNKYGMIRIPKRSRNVAFGGKKNNYIFVTAWSSVFRLRIKKWGNRVENRMWF